MKATEKPLSANLSFPLYKYEDHLRINIFPNCSHYMRLLMLKRGCGRRRGLESDFNQALSLENCRCSSSE